MYVCLCHAVTEKRLKKAVHTGEVNTVREMQNRLGVGTQCGKCACEARTMLHQELSERPQTHPLEHWIPNPFGASAA